MRSITLLLYKPMEGCFEEVSLRLKKEILWGYLWDISFPEGSTLFKDIIFLSRERISLKKLSEKKF